MKIQISPDPKTLGQTAGNDAAKLIREAISKNGSANIILATGTSQFETLNTIINEKNIDWSKVVMFHLDEYIDLPITSPASFRKYLKERFLEKIPTIGSAFLIDGEVDPKTECARLGSFIKKYPIDVALIGIGENGHIAFNDPPADFDTREPYIVVELDEACRKQQFGEGWFPSLNAVPRRAISMSVYQIMLSKNIICSAPDKRKAVALKDCFENEVSNLYPASILQRHAACTCYLDEASASLLTR